MSDVCLKGVPDGERYGLRENELPFRRHMFRVAEQAVQQVLAVVALPRVLPLPLAGSLELGCHYGYLVRVEASVLSEVFVCRTDFLQSDNLYGVHGSGS